MTCEMKARELTRTMNLAMHLSKCSSTLSQCDTDTSDKLILQNIESSYSTRTQSQSNTCLIGLVQKSARLRKTTMTKYCRKKLSSNLRLNGQRHYCLRLETMVHYAFASTFGNLTLLQTKTSIRYQAWTKVLRRSEKPQYSLR